MPRPTRLDFLRVHWAERALDAHANECEACDRLAVSGACAEGSRLNAALDAAIDAHWPGEADAVRADAEWLRRALAAVVE